MLTVILNPASGAAGKADLAPRLAELFLAEGVEARILPLQRSRDLAALMIEAIESKSDAIVAGGGDGTVSNIAASLAGGTIPLGVLPMGTLNHFAKDLHIPLDLTEAVKTIAAGHVVRVDVGTVNDRMFLNNSSIGIYPSFVEARKELRRQNRGKWTALALATIQIFLRSREVFVRLEVEGKSVVTRTPFVFIGNNEYFVEGIHLGGRRSLTGQRLFAYLAPRLHNSDLPKLLLWALAGRTGQHGGFATYSSTEMWIETPQSRLTSVATDGEVTLMVPPLHYRILPGALNVIVPSA